MAIFEPSHHTTMTILETILDILKYIIPAVIVYLLIRQFMNQQLQLSAIQQKANAPKETLPLRLQAYERIMLLCERINLSSLILRLNNPNMTANALKNALMVSVQKEYEHNLTQQIYVSGQLWDMVELLKDNTLSVITSAYIDTERQDIEAFANALYQRGSELDQKIGDKVKAAVRKEVELYFQ